MQVIASFAKKWLSGKQPKPGKQAVDEAIGGR